MSIDINRAGLPAIDRANDHRISVKGNRFTDLAQPAGRDDVAGSELNLRLGVRGPAQYEQGKHDNRDTFHAMEPERNHACRGERL